MAVGPRDELLAAREQRRSEGTAYLWLSSGMIVNFVLVDLFENGHRPKSELR
jgi:hypothetical protein